MLLIKAIRAAQYIISVFTYAMSSKANELKHILLKLFCCLIQENNCLICSFVHCKGFFLVSNMQISCTANNRL